MEHSLLWRIELRLQFTGWFQYVPNAAAAFGPRYDVSWIAEDPRGLAAGSTRA